MRAVVRSKIAGAKMSITKWPGGERYKVRQSKSNWDATHPSKRRFDFA
jgi:hypothetical protein